MQMTPDEFASRATAMRQEKDGYPVINVLENPREWALWIDFFREIGMNWSADEMQRIKDTISGTWTVPTIDPHDFALEFNR